MCLLGYLFGFVLHPYRMHPEPEGLSHGLKSVHSMMVHRKGLVCIKFSFIVICFGFHPHPYRMRPKTKGLSHGLKICHRHIFTPVCGLVPPFRVPSRAEREIKKRIPVGYPLLYLRKNN